MERREPPRALEPESIPAKETVSVPDLHPGDFVEFEHQEMQNPREVLGKGYLSERFWEAEGER